MSKTPQSESPFLDQHAPARVAEGERCVYPEECKHYGRCIKPEDHDNPPPCRPPESPAKEQPGEQDGDAAAMVKRLRGGPHTGSEWAALADEAAALIEKLGQGWIPLDGWKLVPRSLTPEMLTAFYHSDLFVGQITDSAIQVAWQETYDEAPPPPPEHP